MEFTKKPEDPDRIIEQIELPEGQAILIADVPDYVNLPPELGGSRANVIEATYLEFNGAKCIHYKLDKIIDGRNLWVAKSDQFYWHLRG